MPPIDQNQVLDHLGLVAGMFDELGIGEVIDQNIVQDLAKRTVSLGQAVKAMVRNSLGPNLDAGLSQIGQECGAFILGELLESGQHVSELIGKHP
jgi:hypothetical protein